VIEARRPEAVAQAAIKTLVFAEQDPCDHGPPLSGHSGRQRAGQERPYRICGASDTASPPDHPERVGREHDVYALSAQV
jgi:hypothetical protein